ncbi:LysR family transcriptional regulator ArgP [Arthrobacter sp. 35W]|uniref:LysR family transcriptional regulator ArgP n=1 Tax=Arthrobacter sp. 35W TaxID=1132441 RepID=UPI0004173961|nr:LysR family transcriptional regulator ArgP [Arthrobacter sp. 35W]
MVHFQSEHLRTFAAVVEAGTFDAAAGALHVTASAVSQRIKAMEQAAGQVLLRRTTPVQPTAAGETVLRLARQLRQLEQDAASELGLNGLGSAAPIPLVVNADSLATWFLDALASLPPDAGCTFEILREDEAHSTALLRSGAVMAAVTSIPEAVQGCSVAPLGALRYRAVASPGFVDRWMPDGVSAESFALAPVVQFDRSDSLQDRFFRERTGGTISAPQHFIPDPAEFAHAARLGMGWALLPEQHCLSDLADGTLVELFPGTPTDVALYWQRWKLHSPALDQLTDAVRAAATRALR